MKRTEHNLSRAGKPLLVRYDLDELRASISKDEVSQRPNDLWRWRSCRSCCAWTSWNRGGYSAHSALLVRKGCGRRFWSRTKDASEQVVQGPRACSGCVMAKAFGIEHLAMPTNGNAGAALAAYASHAGIRATIFCPEDTPEIICEIALPRCLRLPRQWPDRRLRKARCAGPGHDRLVRRFHSQGALSHRNEDDGTGTGGSSLAGASRCDFLPARAVRA